MNYWNHTETLKKFFEDEKQKEKKSPEYYGAGDFIPLFFSEGPNDNNYFSTTPNGKPVFLNRNGFSHIYGIIYYVTLEHFSNYCLVDVVDSDRDINYWQHIKNGYYDYALQYYNAMNLGEGISLEEMEKTVLYDFMLYNPDYIPEKKMVKTDNKNSTGYIITAENEFGIKKYLCYEGPNYYWSLFEGLFCPKIFISIAEAKNVLKSDEFTKNILLGNTKFPPRMLNFALYNGKLKGNITIKIVPLILNNPVFEKTVEVDKQIKVEERITIIE